MSVADDITSNFAKFQKKWWDETLATHEANADSPLFQSAYKLLAAFNALRENIVAPSSADEPMAFFLEAQNDGLTSLILAELGMWRASLQSLRSFIESALNGLYFVDHRVELLRWNDGTFRTTFSELSKYFDKHPTLQGIPGTLDGMSLLTAEYGTLSKAVHGSAKAMWMSGSGAVNLLVADSARLGSWNSRFTRVLRGGILLITTLHQAKLTGAQNLGTRATVGLALTAAQRAALKSSLKISSPNM
jgi:hypothetical protein